MKKKIVALLVIVSFLMPLSFINRTLAEENEYLTWEYTKGGINIQCCVPKEAYAGDTLTIKIRIEVFETITDFDLWMAIFSTTGYDEPSEDYILWSSPYLMLYFPELSSGVIRNEQFEVAIPSDLQPGMVWGWFDIWWYKDGVWWYLPPYGTVAFTLSCLKDKAYEDLQKAYDELLVQYDELLANYDALNSTYNSLLAKYDALNSTYHSLLVEYNELTDEHERLTSDYDALLTSYESLQNAHESLVSDYAQLEETYNSLESDYENLDDDYDELETGHTALQDSYDSLETTYNSLNSTYNSLKANYDNLKPKHDANTNELNTTRNLSYILVATTIIFAATSIILFARRKVKVE